VRSVCAEKVLLDFINLETNSAGGRQRKKAIEKTILRPVGFCAFLHSLGQIRPIVDACGNGKVAPIPVVCASMTGVAGIGPIADLDAI
jgi:hypothetical protein